MGTTGTFTLALNNLRDVTNFSIQTAEEVIEEVANNGDLIGLGIAVALALTLIFGVVFLVIGFIPKMLKAIKGFKRA